MPRPPRICHLITTWYKRAGSSRRTLEVIRGLKPRGYEIDLLVGREADEPFLKKVQGEGIDVWQVPELQKYVSPSKDLKALGALKRRFAKRRYDLVHTHLAKAGILGRLAAHGAGTPVILHTVHGPSFPDSKGWAQKIFYRQLERWAARYTHGMIYVGEELRRQYLAAGVGSPKKSHLIYTGRDFATFLRAKDAMERQVRRTRLEFQAKELIAGYVARVVPSKGHIYAIRAAERLKSKFPQLRLLFVGEANLPSEQQYKNILLSEVAQRKLRDKVVFLEYQADIENYYAIFDVFILPSLYEGLPNVVLEAAVMGLPVVAFDCGGVREILGERAYLVPRGDFEGFAEKLEGVLDIVKSSEWSSSSPDYVEGLIARWNIEAMIEAKDRLYRELLGERGSRCRD